MLPVTEEIQQDGLALAVARALMVANQTALAEGANLDELRVTITEEPGAPRRCRSVHYGPREPWRVRGGDLIVLVDETTGEVQRVRHGQ